MHGLNDRLDKTGAGHGASGLACNVQSRGRDQTQFRFTVLELVAPSVPREAVVNLEETWIGRLPPRTSGLNDRVRAH